ncbi:helix-turn-helix domain-containing protein [Myroides odoratus]|uniref:Helix-turn-helix domain n=1 Tax=Myroides odoratus TaxID=256 RepID=A0A378RQ22_MYROD|nr:helix-turn-helix transcriptional regulator [Myroides odoratus]QQU04194.1 helix-turn-helix transcriptional regulator [Myroides odoratus]STZ28401.1 Helix-turn-helix domain [Myroides odoratus]
MSIAYEINDRFAESVDHLIKTKKVQSREELSRELGIEPNTLADFISRRTNVGIDVVLKLCDSFGISIEYQLQGKGKMFLDKR